MMDIFAKAPDGMIEVPVATLTKKIEWWANAEASRLIGFHHPDPDRTYLRLVLAATVRWDGNRYPRLGPVDGYYEVGNAYHFRAEWAGQRLKPFSAFYTWRVHGVKHSPLGSTILFGADVEGTLKVAVPEIPMIPGLTPIGF